MPNDTYLTCSSTSPDVLDVYANATLIGKVTSELPGVTDDILLIHFDGDDGQKTYTTEDTGARVVTFQGNAQLDTGIQKFSSTLLLSSATKDYVTLPDSPDFEFGFNNFTVHLWIYPKNDWNGYRAYFSTQDLGGSSYGFVVYTIDDAVVRVTPTQGSIVIATSGDKTLTLNVWNHVAIVRNGLGDTDMNIAIGGSWGNAPQSGNVNIQRSGSGLTLGRFYWSYDGHYPDCNIDEVVIADSALWSLTEDFTPPTAPDSGTVGTTSDTYMICSSTDPDVLDTYVDGVLVGRFTSEIDFSQTLALLHLDGTAGSQVITDECGNTWTADGIGAGGYIINSNYKFGGGCWFAATVPVGGHSDASTKWNFAGDFCIECWWVYVSYPAKMIWSSTTTGDWSTCSTGDYALWNISEGGWLGGLQFDVKGVGYAGGPGTTIPSYSGPPINWHHIAVERYNGVITIYLDGTDVGNPLSYNGIIGNTQEFAFFRAVTGLSAMAEYYMEEIRISNVARYKGNFTPPTTAFPISFSSGDTYIDCATPDKLRIYTDADLILEGTDV